MHVSIHPKMNIAADCPKHKNCKAISLTSDNRSIIEAIDYVAELGSADALDILDSPEINIILVKSKTGHTPGQFSLPGEITSSLLPDPVKGTHSLKFSNKSTMTMTYVFALPIYEEIERRIERKLPPGLPLYRFRQTIDVDSESNLVNNIAIILTLSGREVYCSYSNRENNATGLVPLKDYFSPLKDYRKNRKLFSPTNLQIFHHSHYLELTTGQKTIEDAIHEYLLLFEKEETESLSKFFDSLSIDKQMPKQPPQSRQSISNPLRRNIPR